MRTQKRGFIKETFNVREVNGEIDYLHQRLNELGFPLEEKILTDYTASVADDRIACMRPGLTIVIPLLKEDDDGWVLFIKDKSGEAGTSPITLSFPPGITCEGATTLTISSNYGSRTIQWDFKEQEFFQI
jgi:hypothetical protein